MHTDYCYKHTIHEMTVFLDEGIFLTDDSRQLTAIAYIIDLNDIKPCFKWLYFSSTNKSAQPQLYKQLVSQSKTMTLLEQ